jgi:preflagellin peptidase FlaK
VTGGGKLNLNAVDAIRVLLSLAMLGYTSWADLKTREVYDIVWAVFGALGLILNLYEIYMGSFTLFLSAISVAFSAALALIIGYLGLFGWADALAFIALSILHPVQPRSISPILGIASIIYPLSLLSNSALAGASFAIVLFLRNLYTASRGERLFQGFEGDSKVKKVAVMFTGVKVGMSSVRGPPFQYPLELPPEEGSSERRLILLPDIQDDESAEKIFSSLREEGLSSVWVSHTLPFLVFITIGYILTLMIGDLALAVFARHLLP